MNIPGQLHGGWPSCQHPVIGYYGRFDKSWTGGGTNDTRLSNWLDPINSGVSYLDTKYSTSATLSGPTLVCSGGAAYTVNNVPPNCTLFWENGPNLTRVSAQGSNPCTFSSTNNGSSWIRVKIKSNSNNSYVTLPQHNVWSGTPLEVEITGPSEGYVGNSYTYYAYPAQGSQPTSYQWTLSPPYEGNTIYGYGLWANAAFYAPYEGLYQIGCTAQNTCGDGVMGTTYIYIYYEYGYSVSPNPASNEVTIMVIKNESNQSDLALGNTIFDVSIYNMYGIIQSQNKYSGERFTIPVYNLKDGNYIIKIDNGKSVASKQLVIMH